MAAFYEEADPFVPPFDEYGHLHEDTLVQDALDKHSEEVSVAWKNTSEQLHKAIRRALAKGDRLEEEEYLEALEVAGRRVTDYIRELRSSFRQVNQSKVLSVYERLGYRQYVYLTEGENCEECEGLDGHVFFIEEARAGENLQPLHPNCDCMTGILGEGGKIVAVLVNDTVEEEKRDELLSRKDLLLSEDVMIHTLSSRRFDWDSWEAPEGATWDLLAVEVLSSALNGFVDYFKGQWETVKGAVTDPWGHVKNNLKQYLEKPWMLIGPGALYETVLKPMVLQAVGQWQDLFEGDMSGLSYRAGEATAAGIELLVLNKLGEVVGKYVVKPDGRINKVGYKKKNAENKIKTPKATFPQNPDDFNPEGLTKKTYNTKNGKIVKWFDADGKAVYEWDEDFAHGSHYHVIGDDGNTRLSNPSGEIHFEAGEEIPQ